MSEWLKKTEEWISYAGKGKNISCSPDYPFITHAPVTSSLPEHALTPFHTWLQPPPSPGNGPPGWQLQGCFATSPFLVFQQHLTLPSWNSLLQDCSGHCTLQNCPLISESRELPMTLANLSPTKFWNDGVLQGKIFSSYPYSIPGTSHYATILSNIYWQWPSISVPWAPDTDIQLSAWLCQCSISISAYPCLILCFSPCNSPPKPYQTPCPSNVPSFHQSTHLGVCLTHQSPSSVSPSESSCLIGFTSWIPLIHVFSLPVSHFHLLSFLATSLDQATTFSNLKCCTSLLLPLFYSLYHSPNKALKCKYDDSFLYWKLFKSFIVIRIKTNILIENLNKLLQAKLSSFISI